MSPIFRVCLALLVGGASPLKAETIGPPVPESVSLIQLIATPERYDGRVVRIVGFCWLEHEGNGLFVSREDSKHLLTKNALWLDLDETEKSTHALKGHYVLVEGTFSARNKGHLGLFSGALEEISRAERWTVRRR